MAISSGNEFILIYFVTYLFGQAPIITTYPELPEDRNGEIYVAMDVGVCLDAEGNACWYEKEFSAGTGLQVETIRKVEFSESLEPIREEWLTYTSEQMDDPETGFAIVPTGYYVYGESVDYETYRREDLKRRQLVPIYTTEICSYSYPEAWDEMVANAAVLSPVR